MTRISIDPATEAKLRNLLGIVELCGESGQILGRFIPRVDPQAHILEPQISKEERERRKHSNEKTYTTVEVLAHLEKL